MNAADATALKAAAAHVSSVIKAGGAYTVTMAGTGNDNVTVTIRNATGEPMTPMEELAVLGLIEAGSKMTFARMEEIGHEAWTRERMETRTP